MQKRHLVFGLTALGAGAVIMYHNVAPAKVPGSSQEVAGKEVYLKSCKECHGVIGAPTKAALRKYEKIRDFTEPGFFNTRKDAELIEAVEKGKGRDMKGFADKLNKDEIKAVAAYIRTLEKKA